MNGVIPGVNFYMMRYGEAGASWIDLEASFEGLRYKSCAGLNDYGELSSNYAESYPETGKAEVHVGRNPVHKQTSIVLTLLFFEGDGDAGDGKDDSSYHRFVDFVTGCEVAYRDTARRRKVLMYLTGASKPKHDTLYGKKYKEVSFTFTNVYGFSFGYEDAFPEQ